jgi:hypothetical protein
VNAGGEPIDDPPRDDKTCNYEMNAFTTYDVSTMADNAITATIQPLVDGQPSYVSSEDGSITLSFKAGIAFPKYGGSIQFSAPNWFTTSAFTTSDSNGG